MSAPPLAAVPYVRTDAPVCFAMAATRASSALRMAVPDFGSAATNSCFAFATPSIPPTRSVCEWPTAVTTPMSGRATSHREVISPNPRIPISSTSTSVSSGALRIVIGKPCSLLKLRSFAVVLRSAEHAAEIRSFVDVLPTLPVTPTTVVSSCCRAQPARRINESAVSATSIDVPSLRHGSASDVRCATAPASRATPMNS